MDLAALLADLGISVELEDGVRISDAVLVTKEVDLSDGTVSVATYESDTTDWVTVHAMIDVAAKLNSAPIRQEGDQ